MLFNQNEIRNQQISFHIQGGLNRTGVKRLKQLLNQPSQNLSLNLKNVTSINAKGLSFLLKLQEVYQRANLRLQLEDLPIRVQMFLAFTGTVSAFEISRVQVATTIAA